MGKRLDHIYEVYTVDSGRDIIVDILRFDSEIEARDFESGIIGDFKLRNLTFSPYELIEILLDQKEELIEEKYKLEDQVEKLDGALQIAKLYMEDIIPSNKPSNKINNRGKGTKIYPFNSR